MPEPCDYPPGESPDRRAVSDVRESTFARLEIELCRPGFADDGGDEALTKFRSAVEALAVEQGWDIPFIKETTE
jgi:hypothetical protein